MHVKQRISTIYRIWREIACRLRRRGAVVSVIMLLTIGLIEPLACIIHCELQAVFAQVGAQSDTPLHLHHHQQNTSATAAVHGAAPAPAATQGCPLLHSPNSPSPDLPAPQPFHEMVLLAIMPLPLIVRRRLGRWTSLVAPPRCTMSPHFRPPILCA